MKYPNGIDKFNTKLNKSTTPYAIEEVVSVSDGVYNNYLAHDNIIDSSIRVHTGSKLTGERINNFLITKNDKEDWKREIKIFTNHEVVYITYETYGDQIEAGDVNDLQESIVNTQTEIERYKKVNDDKTQIHSNKIQNLENSKADKVNTYTKSEVYNKSETDARIQNVVGAAPQALDTLQEISASLNNDPEFSNTIINELSKKVNIEPNKQLSTENFSTEEKQKLSGIEEGANRYILPNATTSVLGGVKLVEGVASTSKTTAATPNSVKTVNDSLTAHKNDSSIHVSKSYIDSNLEIAKGYSDSNLLAAKEYSNNNLTSSNVYSDEKLAEAKLYSDGKLTEAKSYSDVKLTEAKNFSTVNLGSANSYTDEKLIEAKSYTDAKNGEANLYSDGNLAKAKTYADSKTTEAKNLANTNLTKANTYTDEKLVEAKIYADGKLGEANSITTTKFNEAQAYSDLNLDASRTYSDSNLATAKTYTDEKVSAIPVVSTTVDGFMGKADKVKLDGIATGANKYVLPAATTTVVGGVKLVNTTNSTSTTTAATPNSVKLVNDALITHGNDATAHITDAERTYWNAKTDKSYVDSKISDLVNSAPETLDTLGEVAIAISETDNALEGLLTTVGTKANATDLTAHTGNGTIHITSTERANWNAKANTAVATSTSNGLMHTADKVKLDSIEAGANNYILPNATTSVVGGVKLSTSTTSTSTSTAATSSAIKSVNDALTTKITDVETALTNNINTHTHPQYVTHDQLGQAGLGDMSKGVYDTNNNGIVDKAESVAWTGVTGKPSTFSPSSHTHSISDVTNLQTELDSKLNKSGGTVDGILTLKNTELSAENITFDGSTAAGMKVNNGNGYVSIAPLNTTGAHIYTDRPRFYFNKTLSLINGELSSYNGDLVLQHKYVTKLTLGATLAAFANQVQAPSFVQTDGKEIETAEGSQAKATQALNDAKAYVDASNTIAIKDTRSVNTSPSEYQTGSLSKRLNVEFKYLTTMGISSVGTYCTVITDSRWTGSSGGKVNQIALTDDGTIFTRVSLNSTDWSSWRKQLDNRGVSWNDLKGV